MDIFGLGNDIIEISRIEKAILRNKKFIEKIFTDSEIKYIEKKANKYESYAGRFAAKEAISKAFGTGVRDFAMTDIEILNDELGKPNVYLKNRLKEKYSSYNIMLSISHNKSSAIATAIVIKSY